MRSSKALVVVAVAAAAASAAALGLPLSPALAADKDEIEVVGFSEDATVFAYFTYGVHDGSGYPHAELNVYSTLTGKRSEKDSARVQLESGAGDGAAALARLKAEVAPRLEALELGKDQGVEMYRSGTPTRTSFTVAGKTVEIRLSVTKGKAGAEDGLRKDRAAVTLRHAGKRRTLLSESGGFDYSLNSVRLAADGRTLAVLLKRSEPGFEGANRRYLCTAARLAAP